LQAFLERAPDGHGFAGILHVRGELGSACGMVAVRKHLEGKARNVGYDVINGRLEARGGFARDLVLDFVEQVTDGAGARRLRRFNMRTQRALEFFDGFLTLVR